jgi:very-long-chain (3R)-3-hydroxyacyl-CoA dehydratase
MLNILFLQIDFDRWKAEDDVDDEEPRDIMGDYPDLYEKLVKEELGYRKGWSQTVALPG